jgi:hypothetical protein
MQAPRQSGASGRAAAPPFLIVALAKRLVQNRIGVAAPRLPEEVRRLAWWCARHRPGR